MQLKVKGSNCGFTKIEGPKLKSNLIQSVTRKQIIHSR